MNKNTHSSGFSPVEIIMLFLLIGLISGAGWYVWNNQRNDSTATPAASTAVTDDSVEDAADAEETDETESWTTLTSAQNAFSVKIPGGWNMNTDLTRDFIFSDASNAALETVDGEGVAVKEWQGYGSDAPLRFSVSTSETERAAQADEVETSFGTVDGVSGKRRHYTETNDAEFGVGFSKGDQQYAYLFQKGGTYYTASYTIKVGDTNRLETIEKVVKTLDFK